MRKRMKPATARPAPIPSMAPTEAPVLEGQSTHLATSHKFRNLKITTVLRKARLLTESGTG